MPSQLRVTRQQPMLLGISGTRAFSHCLGLLHVLSFTVAAPSLVLRHKRHPFIIKHHHPCVLYIDILSCHFLCYDFLFLSLSFLSFILFLVFHFTHSLLTLSIATLAPWVILQQLLQQQRQLHQHQLQKRLARNDQWLYLYHPRSIIHQR